jgi:hypothetical protein
VGPTAIGETRSSSSAVFIIPQSSFCLVLKKANTAPTQAVTKESTLEVAV